MTQLEFLTGIQIHPLTGIFHVSNGFFFFFFFTSENRFSDSYSDHFHEERCTLYPLIINNLKSRYDKEIPISA